MYELVHYEIDPLSFVVAVSRDDELWVSILGVRVDRSPGGCGSVLLLLGAFWDAGQGRCRICSGDDPYSCPESLCTADLHEGAFWDSDRGECEVCSSWSTYYCPESMCTAALHEGALPFSWQYDP